MGQHWDQPHPGEITIENGVAFMTAATFKKLKNYSCSLPSGTYQGKMWRKAVVYEEQHITARWKLCWYVDIDMPGQIGIQYREISIL